MMRWSRSLLFASTLALGATALLHAPPAAAWDPSTTHQGLLEIAIQRSALHLRWMDASELERGVFTALSIDPQALSHEELRLLQRAMHQTHADLGAAPLGGPGSCPSADAPPDTQLFCVDRELWQQSALGWLRLGMIAEVSPSARLVHHFLDREHPDAARWEDTEMSAAVLRARQARTNGEPAAGVATRTNFGGASTSALGWLGGDDLLAPEQTFAHLSLASTAPTQAKRDHHLALAMLGVGALLHVVQDLSVPAHARGDATAFFSRLSPSPGDRGLPLQEFVRIEYGRRSLPGIPSTDGPPSGVPLAESIEAHILGDGSYGGLATLARRHFLSEFTVPAPRFLDLDLSATEAAAALLGDAHGLDPSEVDGAILSPWPADQGYLLSPTGRALAAFDLDPAGRVRAYLDRVCYRDQAAILLPAAADNTRSILDLLWPAWPETIRSGDQLSLAVPATWAKAELTVYVETSDGARSPRGQARALTPGTANEVSVVTATLAEGSRLVLVIQATRQDGPPIVIERRLSSDVPSEPPADLSLVPDTPMDPDSATDPDAPADSDGSTDPDAPADPDTAVDPDTSADPDAPVNPETSATADRSTGDTDPAR